jgi:hypothetical protein
MPSMENIRQTVLLNLGAPASASNLAALFANTDLLIKKVTLLNGATIAADNTNFVTLSLKNGANVVASLDSRAANQGAVTSLTGKQFVVDPGAAGYATVAAGSTLSFNTVLGGTGALTAGQLQIEYVRIKGN